MNRVHEKFDPAFMEKFFREVLLEYLQETLSATKPVINFKPPETLKTLVDFTIGEDGITQEQLIAECRNILNHQIRPYHPHFHNLLFGGFDQLSILGNMLTTCVNGTMFTYEVAPCYTLMENSVFEHMKKRIGWDAIDGIMTPGGSFANWNGLLLARYHRFPESKRTGIQGLKKIKIFTSEQSHYSIDKGAILEGYGLDNIVKVKCNQMSEMDPEDLELQIKNCIEGDEIPLFVCATAGTSVAGAIDPVTEIGKVCKKYNVWLHLDAALGGAFWMSDKLRDRLGDCSNVDSITWDPHKALVVPLQATFFMCKHPGLMEHSNSTKADYLFHKERTSYNVNLDTGDKSLQCGRVIDIWKVWTYFKGNGWKEIARQIELEWELASYLTEKIQKDPSKWILIYPAATIMVSYFYIPKEMRGLERDAKFYETLSKVTVDAKKIMIQEGKMIVGYATNGRDKNYFWRNVMSNPFLSFKDIDFEQELIEQYCETAYSHLMAKTKSE